MSGLQQKYWVFHEITVGATCTKHATYKEPATEFFKEIIALNTDAAIFDLKNKFFKDMCNCNWKLKLRWKCFILILFILLSYGLQRVADEVRAKIPEVNKLISMTKCFWKPHIECSLIRSIFQTHSCSWTSANKVGEPEYKQSPSTVNTLILWNHL